METVIARVPFAVAVTAALAAAGYALRLVTRGGALVGFAVGVAVYLGTGLPGFLCLGAFFVVGSMLTKVGYARKVELGGAETRGGARGAGEVLAKGGVAVVLALGVLWTEVTAYATVGFAGALAAALADTAGTEVGQLSRGGTWLLGPLKRVAPGTPGGVSLLGFLAAAAGALVMVVLAGGLGMVTPTAAACAGVGGLLGTVVESVVKGATQDRLGHYAMNFITTGAGALLAVLFWSILS